ncbi:PREDICTED: endomucin [Nipponia nippon]|uniref:endomucin n=1 Tax=Nipponia nippon TaxID=128390 RepID=UPI000510EC27|nr:PREDICTED: endomucin [Nipponia nippon]
MQATVIVPAPELSEDDILTSTVNATVSASTSKPVTEAVTTSTSQAATLKMSVLTTTAIRRTNESITSSSKPSSPSTTKQITQSTRIQLPTETTTAAADKSGSTTNTTRASGTQLAQTESLNASSAKGWSFSSTISLQNTTSTPGISGPRMSSPTGSTTFGSRESSPGNKKVPESVVHYSNIILPIVITLIVITLSAFSLVALYRMCQKKTPERQENGTEQAQSDKEGVKLLSVKTTSTETVFGEVRDIYEVGFLLPPANLYEPTTPSPSGEVSQGRTLDI